jgi:hypothetical protein
MDFLIDYVIAMEAITLAIIILIFLMSVIGV